MKQILFILIIFFFVCCGSVRKMVNRNTAEAKRTERYYKDSAVLQFTDSIAVQQNSYTWKVKADSSYERIIEEEIIEFTTAKEDSLDKDHLVAGAKIIRTKRKIRERGTKASETNKQAAWHDSVSRKTAEQSTVAVKKEADSAGKTSISMKTTNRSGIPWYIWVIVCIAIGCGIWWKGKRIVARIFSVKL